MRRVSAVRVRAWPVAMMSAAALDVLAHSLCKSPAARSAVRFGAVVALLGIARGVEGVRVSGVSPPARPSCFLPPR